MELKSVAEYILVKLTWSPPVGPLNRTCREDRLPSFLLLLCLYYHRDSEHNGSEQPDNESKRFPDHTTFKCISRSQIFQIPFPFWQPWKMWRGAEKDQSCSFSFNFFARFKWSTNFYPEISTPIEYFWWIPKISQDFPANFLAYFQLIRK